VHASADFLQGLAMVLCIAALTTVVCQRLGLPVVVGYLLAGMVVSDQTPGPRLADPSSVQTLSELGVILLMFSLGLDFSLRRLVRTGMVAALVALVETSLMIWLGSTTAQLLGWQGLAALFAGATVAISSTTIVVKSFAALLALPFVIGLLRTSRVLGAALSAAALPIPPAGQTDLADVPRRAMAVGLQVAVLLLVATPLIAATQSFVPPPAGRPDPGRRAGHRRHRHLAAGRHPAGARARRRGGHGRVAGAPAAVGRGTARDAPVVARPAPRPRRPGTPAAVGCQSRRRPDPGGPRPARPDRGHGAGHRAR
jgi:hypothetical protein